MVVKPTREYCVIWILLLSAALIPVAEMRGVDRFESIKSKFEPWLWDKVKELEANGTTRFMVIGVSINPMSYRRQNVTDAYNFRIQMATLLAQEHNATILYIGRVLSFINVKVRVQEIKKIAAYEFVDGLADGEAEGNPFLSVSTTTVRSIIVNNMGYDGSGINVSIIDSGIDPNHPDFSNKTIIWRDFVNGQPNPYDDCGHGTHVAGILAGTGQNSSGKYKGVAPGITKLIIGKIMYYDSFRHIWTFQEADARAALDWAASEGAQIISCSWGIPRQSDQSELSRKADDIVSKGVVVVVAAGNEGPGLQTIADPGIALNVITVGAIDDQNTRHNKDDTLYLRSSRGPTTDDRIKPDVVAPGVHIISTRATNTDIRNPDEGDIYIDDWYVEATGTSMATPHVAGVAALILQAHPTWAPDMVKFAIKDTAGLNDQLVWPNPIHHPPEWDRGNGTIDASLAVSLHGTNIPADQAETNYMNGSGTYTANAYLNGTYKISAGSRDSDQGYAIATLNKTFILEYNSTNPKFFFTFQDEGMMETIQEPAEFNATLKLFAPNGDTLFSLNQQIHYLSASAEHYFCNHTIEHKYLGMLYAQQNYTIEYGFSTYAHEGAYTIFEIIAKRISTMDGTIFGPGNPSFEERLYYASVYNVSYWWSNNEGWRNVRCDLGGPINYTPTWGAFDGIVDSFDLSLFIDAYGKNPYGDKYRWYADFNGDGKIDGDDLSIFIVSYQNDNPPQFKDGLYSWYTSGGGDYNISQWLCDHDVNAMKSCNVTFTFWFKPKTIVNFSSNARAEINCILANGTEIGFISLTTVPTEVKWYSASITTTIPTTTIAIKIIIYGGPNFRAWVDKTFITAT
jgi:subtilisin family serine protease